MEPREVTQDDAEMFGPPCRAVVLKAPPGSEGKVNELMALQQLTEEGTVWRVPWQPNELEVAALAKGGTIWLSVWGEGFPPVGLYVQGSNFADL